MQKETDKLSDIVKEVIINELIYMNDSLFLTGLDCDYVAIKILQENDIMRLNEGRSKVPEILILLHSTCSCTGYTISVSPT